MGKGHNYMGYVGYNLGNQKWKCENASGQGLTICTPTAGEKPALMLRIELHVNSRGLLVNGVDPFDLKPADLRKAVAARGLNPMGDRDELLGLLIPRALEEQQQSRGGGEVGDGDRGGASAGALDVKKQAEAEAS